MVLGAGCPNLDSETRPLVDPLNSLVSAIDGAVAQITAASGSWQTVLQDTLKQLTADAQSIVRNEIQTLLSNSIVAVQVGAMCTTDFVGHRVVTVLQEIKAKLLGGSPPIEVPFLCSSGPLAVEFAAWQQSRVPVITLTGFDTVGDDVGRTRLLRASFNPLGLHAVEIGNCVTRSQARSLLAAGRGVTSALVAHLQAALNP
jgi:hypothetical protein